MRKLAAVIFRDAAGRILLQYRDSGAPAAALMWSFFGGCTDTEEESPTEAAVREAKEELGMEISESDLRLLSQEVHTEEEEREVFFFEYAPVITWDDVAVYEGAGAAFLTKEEIAMMPDTTETAKYFVAKYT